MTETAGGCMPKNPSNDRNQEPVANFPGLERCRELVDELRSKLDSDALANATPSNDGAERPTDPSPPEFEGSGRW